MKKKIFKIPVEWAVFGVVEIEANSFEEAIEIFDKTNDEIPLPEGDYIDGSFKRGKFNKTDGIKEDIEYYKMFN